MEKTQHESTSTTTTTPKRRLSDNEESDDHPNKRTKAAMTSCDACDDPKTTDRIVECTECSNMFCLNCHNDPNYCRYQEKGCTSILCMNCARWSKTNMNGCTSCEVRTKLYENNNRLRGDGTEVYGHISEERSYRRCNACAEGKPKVKAECGCLVCTECQSEQHTALIRMDSEGDDDGGDPENPGYSIGTMCHTCATYEENSGCF